MDVLAAIIFIVFVLGVFSLISQGVIEGFFNLLKQMPEGSQPPFFFGTLICLASIGVYVFFSSEPLMPVLFVICIVVGLLVMVQSLGAGDYDDWREARGCRVVLSWLTILVGNLFLVFWGFSEIGAYGIIALLTITGLYITWKLLRRYWHFLERFPAKQARPIFFGTLICVVTVEACLLFWLIGQEDESLLPVLLIAGLVIGLLTMVSAIGAGQDEEWGESRTRRIVLSWLTLVGGNLILVYWGYFAIGGTGIAILVVLPICFGLGPHFKVYLKQQRVRHEDQVRRRHEESEAQAERRRRRSADEDDFRQQVQLEEQIAFPLPPRLYAPPYAKSEDRLAARVEDALRLLPGQQSFFDAEVKIRSLHHSQPIPLGLFSHYREFLSDLYLHLRRSGSDMGYLRESLDKLCRLFGEDATSLYTGADNVLAREQAANEDEKERLRKERKAREEAESAKRKRAAKYQEWERAKAEAMENRLRDLKSSVPPPTPEEEETEMRYFELKWIEKNPAPE